MVTDVCEKVLVSFGFIAIYRQTAIFLRCLRSLNYFAELSRLKNIDLVFVIVSICSDLK